MKRSKFQLIIVFIICVLFLGCRASKPEETYDQVKLQLKWSHQAQFAGFYMAEENGHYAQERLKVTFLKGGQKIDPAQQIIDKQADFATLAPEDIIIKRSQGLPLTAIATIFRRSAIVFIARSESGITKPSDFLGKRVAVGKSGKGVLDFKLQFQALMNKLNLDDSKILIADFDPTFKSFFQGEVDVTPAYYTGGAIKLRQKGLKLNLIWPFDYGIRFYSDILATNEKLILEKPDLVLRFIRASLRGWQDAVGNVEKAAEVTLKYAENKDFKLQKKMLEAVVPLVHTGSEPIGMMKPKEWNSMYNIINNNSLLNNPFPKKSIYDMDFLDQLYPGEKGKQ